MFVDMDKARGREDAAVNLDEEEYYLQGEPDKDIAPFNPKKPRAIAYDFGKGQDRFPQQNENDYQTDERLVLDVQYPDKKIPNVVFMDGGEPRFKDKLPEDPFYNDLPINELANDINKALKAIKPNVPKVSLSKGSLKDNKDLKEVMLL